MELKLPFVFVACIQYILLIVPYGIETYCISLNTSCSLLLIVPYGIETPIGKRINLVVILLIVPYGIETESYAFELVAITYF